MTIAIGSFIFLTFIVFSILIFNFAFAAGKGEGYREAAEDCRRGVIPQYEGMAVKVYGATGRLAPLPDLERHSGLRPAEDDPSDGA